MKNRALKKIVSIIAAVIIAAAAVPAGAFIPQSSSFEASAATVKIKPSSITLSVGDTQKIKLKNNSKAVTWTLLGDCVRIDKKTKKYVKVTAVSAGVCTITAKVGGKKYTCAIMVKDGSGSSSGTPSGNASAEEARALDKANSYLRHSAFSREGLKHQLDYEGFSEAACEYAVAHCGADWNQQSLKKAQSYLSRSAFSREGLKHQLEYEKFTTDQAEYGVANCGADWKEQAVKKAKSYLSHSSFSRESLLRQLLYEKFTQEEAEYGVAMAY